MQVLILKSFDRRTVPLLSWPDIRLSGLTTHTNTQTPIQAETGVSHCGWNILQFILLIAAIELMLAAFGDILVADKLNQRRAPVWGEDAPVRAPLRCKAGAGAAGECQELLECLSGHLREYILQCIAVDRLHQVMIDASRL